MRKTGSFPREQHEKERRMKDDVRLRLFNQARSLGIKVTPGMSNELIKGEISKVRGKTGAFATEKEKKE